MKNLILLLFALNCVAQSSQQKEKIKSATSIDDKERLIQQYNLYMKEQDVLIKEYLKYNSSSLVPSRIVDGNPIYFGEDNFGSVTTLRGNSMYPGGSLGLNVTGQGIIVGVWDGGKVRDTHQEFSGRIILGDAVTTLSPHATHVTGTIIAQGISPSRRGFAYQANAKTHDWNSDITEMINFAAEGFLMSNHSYGNIASSLQSFYFGNYNSQSVEIDNLMNTFPYYQVVKSAGNDRNDITLAQVGAKGGYDLLSGVSTAKNVLTVAAVGQVNTYNGPASVVMSSFSNFGPTDDGRIKPDIAAKGVDVSSCNSSANNAYTDLNGTSMAAPAITGLIALLQKHYSNLNSSNFMRSASVRALLCHSAREAGLNTGPDYEFGWGLADGYEAARVISNKGTTAIFDEKTLMNSETFTLTFTINSTQNINAAIAWTDPTGTANAVNDEDNRSPRLRNNLDLKIIKDGTIYYPWKLDPDLPTEPATNNSDNDVDNIERVEIFNATPGTYTIQVSHKGTLQNGSQDYTLIATGSTALSVNDNLIADNSFFVYPNPADTVLNFSNPDNIAVSNISITDMTGKLIVNLNNNLPANAIDISNLQSGVYFVKFTTENKSVIKKFIKN